MTTFVLGTATCLLALTATLAVSFAQPLIGCAHKDQEENLSAAKKSLKEKAYMHRRTDLSGDVIDIIDDGKIIVNCSQIV